MKIIQFISSLSDGGAETLVKDYALTFKRHPELNIDCIIVTLHNFKNSANYKRLQNSGIEIIPIYKHHNKLVSFHRKIFGKWYVPQKLKKLIKHHKPGAIHLHLQLLKYLKPISSELKDVKLLYTCHSEPTVMFGHHDGEKEAASFLIKHNNLQLIALHEEMRRELNTMFCTQNTEIINNGIDFKAFRNITKTKAEIRRNLNIPVDSFLIGHVGRFVEVKNHAFLLKIFNTLLKYKRNARLLLIGTGPLKKQIQHNATNLGIDDKITVLSNRSDIPELLKCMDVFVFPSLFEGLSVSLVEAQVSGLRCIISDKIKQENLLKDTTIQVSLEASTETWCETIIDINRKNEFHYDISVFDMDKEIVKLSKLYLY